MLVKVAREVQPRLQEVERSTKTKSNARIAHAAGILAPLRYCIPKQPHTISFIHSILSLATAET